jgi:G3E family GTPase
LSFPDRALVPGAVDVDVGICVTAARVERAMDKRIPITVLTGGPGAGKSTLLNHILSEDHVRRYAVIVNTVGEIGIDNDLLVQTDEELFEMNNGCICCTVRGDLIRTLHGLLTGGAEFDAVIIETTGMAAPAPVVQTFFVDYILEQRTRLDSVTTLVDAKEMLSGLNKSGKAADNIKCVDDRASIEQIAFADQIVLNKIEEIDEAALAAVEARLRCINPLAAIHRARQAVVAIDKVLEREAFDLAGIALPISDFPAPGEYVDASGMQTISLHSNMPMDGELIGRWLEALVAGKGADILRAKGIIDVSGEDRQLVFQSVHMLLEGGYQQAWRAGKGGKENDKGEGKGKDDSAGLRGSRLVFIGRHLDRTILQTDFASCAAVGIVGISDSALASAA